MIQRQQTLWLLLAAITSFLTYQFPFYTGLKLEVNGQKIPTELDGGGTFFLVILTGLSILVAIITIFIYKDRKNQLLLSIGGTVLSIILLILYFTEIKKYENGHFALTSIFAFATFVGYVMATRGIRKDQKLIKSLDKLR